jgi:hypothetical protein
MWMSLVEMNTCSGRRRRADRLPRGVDVAVVRAAERRDHRALDDLGDAPDRVQLAGDEAETRPR